MGSPVGRDARDCVARGLCLARGVLPARSAPWRTVAAEPAAAPTETLGADEVSQFTAWMDVQPREDLGVPANGAKVVVVKFNDYQCPACRQAYLAYRSLQESMEMKYPGQVRS